MRKTTQALITLAAVALCATLITGCSAKARMARHQQRADSDFAAGDYSKAEVEYLVVLRLDHANTHAISRLGTIYYEQGRYGRALSFVSKACELATNDVDLHVKLGLIYLNLHASKEAGEQALWVLDKSPTNADAPDILAESITSRADLDRAQQRMEKLSKQIGDTAPLELGFAILDFASGDQKAAETALKRSLALDPKSSAAYNTLGNLYLSQNKRADADAAFKIAAELAPLRSSRRLSYANFKIQTGDLAEGKRLLEEITKQVPDYVPAWLREAEIALAEKRFSDCYSLLGQVLGRDTDNYDALLLRGRLYLVQGQGEKAVAEMDRMAAIYTRSGVVQYYLALAHLSVSDSAKASADLNKALFLQPRYPEATLLLAGLNLTRGDTASAVSSLTQLIQQQPGIIEAYRLLANAYLMQNEPDQALTIYSKMAELFPKDPQVPFLTGMVLMQQKKSGAARTEFEKTLALSPHSLIAVEELVDLDIADNQFTAALNRINKETDEKSGVGRNLLLAKVHIARARSLAGNGSKTSDADVKLNVPAAQDDVNQAESELLKCIELEPGRPVPYLLLSQLYVAAGKEQAALDRLNGLIGRTNNVAAYMQMGTIYDALKKYPSARDAYEKALATDPNFTPAINNLSYLYSERLGDIDKGYELAEKARQLSPHDPSVADTLGWILYKKGEYLRALGLLTESASGLVGQPEVQLHLGLVHYMLGEEGPARVALQEAASSPDEFPGKEEAGRHLAILAVNVKTADAKTRADLEKRLQDMPSDPVAANRLAAIYERDGSLDKAARTYEQVLKQNPQNAQIMSRLARIYVSLNDSEKAMDMARQAHKFAPADPAVSSLLGRLVFQSGDYNWAASLLQEAAPKLPDQPEVQYDLAWSYYSVGRVAEAERTMQGAVSALTTAKLDDAKQFLAMIAAAKIPTAAAAAQAGQILAANPNYVPAMIVSARRAEQQGKPDDAKTFYEKAIARYPAFTPAARNLAILYAQHPGDDQKAYDLGVKARTAYPDDPELARALGVLAYRRGDYARATELLQDSSLQNPKDGELLYYLGMAHYQLKQNSKSKAELQRALGLNLESKLAEDARKTLAELK